MCALCVGGGVQKIKDEMPAAMPPAAVESKKKKQSELKQARNAGLKKTLHPSCPLLFSKRGHAPTHGLEWWCTMLF